MHAASYAAASWGLGKQQRIVLRRWRLSVKRLVQQAGDWIFLALAT